MEFRSRPKSNYLLNAEWQELHALTGHWQSDIKFFEDEISFLALLFDKYFAAFTDKENIERTKAVAANLSSIETQRKEIGIRIVKHLHRTEALLLDPFANDSASLRNEHEALEDELTSFVKSFRGVKQEVFNLAERVAVADKTKRFITS